jgi:hypothetical protein
MKNFIYSIIGFIFLTPIIIAQSGFEDADGKSSVILGEGGTGRINISDANIKVSYLYRNSKSYFRFGIEFTGKAENGFAPLFQNENIAPNAGGKISFGYQWILSKKPKGEPITSIFVDDWLTLQIGYNRAQYKLFFPNNAMSTQIQKQDFDGYNITGYYNILFKQNFFLGLSLGFNKENNYQSLKEIEITDKSIIIDSSGFQRSTNNTFKIREGTYKTSNHVLFNYDLIWVPDFMKDLIGIDIFGRYDKDPDNNNFTPGIGIFITQRGAPTQVIGGISFSYEQKELKIGFISGYNF